MPGLLCHDCGIFRNKFAGTVLREVIEGGKKITKIVGYRCIKCSRKKYVENSKSSFGQGWRVRFGDFVRALNHQRQRLQAPMQSQEMKMEEVQTPKKEGFGSKIKKFFQGKNKS